MLENLNVTNKKYHVKITIVILSFVLILTGCSRNKSDEEMAIEKLTEYFEIRYSGLTVDNFYKRYEKMKKYYSESLLGSDSWLIDPLNFDSTYHNLYENGIKTEILYLDIKHEKNNVYNTGIIVKYDTANSKHSYCAEYRFKVLYEEDEIINIERISYNEVDIGECDYTISDGIIIIK